MKHKLILLSILVSLVYNVNAQVLFTYGNKKVSVAEFREAYHKNSSSAGKGQSIEEYLDLYIRYKLKVQAAYDAKLDTSSVLQQEIENYRDQVMVNYMASLAPVEELTAEYIERAVRDIRFGHIFIPVNYLDVEQAEAAKDSIMAAYEQLKKGRSFEEVAQAFSSDPMVNKNQGYAGFISVGVLPYIIESKLYALSKGAYSAPFPTAYGWHILKNGGERKSPGRIKVAQILLTSPVGDQASAGKMKKLADSIYVELKKGADFNALAREYSHDLFSVRHGGELPAFGAGEYDPEFETQAFSLKVPGEFTKPFQTSHGYHILRLVEMYPPASLNDSSRKEEIREFIRSGDRMDEANSRLEEKIKKKLSYKEQNINSLLLEKFTQSVLKNPRGSAMQGLQPDQELFRIGAASFSVNDYREYLAREATQGSRISQPPSFYFRQFIEQSVFDAYKKDLKKYEPAFKKQLDEFRDASLLFSIMQSQIWDKAALDSAGLKDFYNKRKDQYAWKDNADVIMFTVFDPQVAVTARTQLANDPSAWRQIMESHGGYVQADSTRLEIDQLPVKEGEKLRPGTVSTPIKNEVDGTTGFVYLLKLYPGGEPRSFEEARGMVLNDYHQLLEESWITELKNKYPVHINRKQLPKD